MSEYINVSRRTFLKGTAAVAGAALAGGAYEIVHPEGAVAEEAPIEVKNTYCDMCNHVPKCGIAASVKDARWCAWRRATSTRPTPFARRAFPACRSCTIRIASRIPWCARTEGHGCARMGAHLLGRRVRAHRQRAQPHQRRERSRSGAVLLRRPEGAAPAHPARGHAVRQLNVRPRKLAVLDGHEHHLPARVRPRAELVRIRPY